IYVAGHRGLVGSSVVRKLLKDGYTKVITRTSKELDLRRQADVEAFFERERPEYVILAAAKVGGILANSTYTAEFIYDNTIIAANVVQSAYRYGVKKLLNLGSSCIYPKLAPQPIKEEHLLTGVLEPTNEPYAVAKIAAIKLCRYYNEQYGTNFISVMPTNLYGPHDNFNLETAHVLPALIRKFHLAKLLRQKNYDEIKKDLDRTAVGFNLNLDQERLLEKLGITPDYLVLWGSGEPYREFLYVDDLADACIFLMGRYNYKEVGEFVNVGTGEDIRIKELASLIQKIVKYEGELKYDLSKPDGTPRKLLDVSRLKLLGWQSKTSLEEGIRNTYDWYLSRL
ncbi:MAG: GDP-L-fucose synthase, partial [Planctomycetota bacterium]